MTDLQAVTLASISALCSSSFRMKAVIQGIIKDRDPDRTNPDTVRHWLMMEDAIDHLLQCMEKAAEVECDQAVAEEVAESLEVMRSRVETESAEARLTAEFLRQNLLPPNWPGV